jgi:hypothetical protein
MGARSLTFSWTILSATPHIEFGRLARCECLGKSPQAKHDRTELGKSQKKANVKRQEPLKLRNSKHDRTVQQQFRL